MQGAALLCLLLFSFCVSCSESSPSGGESSAFVERQDVWQVPLLLPRWEFPTAEEQLQRELANLRSATKQALRLSTERLVARGPSVVPILEQEIALNAVDPSAMAYLINLADTLARVGGSSDGNSLVRVLEHSPVAVARTAALDAILVLNNRALLPALFRHASRETEEAPRKVLFTILGKWGAEAEARFLIPLADSWLNGGDQAEAGQVAWASLLALEHPLIRDWLLQQLDSLAPSLRVQALTTLVDQGAPDLRNQIRAMLDSSLYPSGQLRALAITLLASIQDWEGILAASNDIDPSVVMAIAHALLSPEAVAGDVGLDFLDNLSRANSPELQAMALKALLARNHTEYLDPWINRLRKYPSGEGSVSALLLLKEDGISDDRFAPLLISRWPYCDMSFRVDLIRALVFTQSAEAREWAATVAANPDEVSVVRQAAIMSLGSYDPPCISAMLDLWSYDLRLSMQVTVVNSLLHGFEQEKVQALLKKIASDPMTHAVIRAQLYRDFVRLMGVEAQDYLYSEMQNNPSTVVRNWLNALLHEHF